MPVSQSKYQKLNTIDPFLAVTNIICRSRSSTGVEQSVPHEISETEAMLDSEAQV